MNRSDFPRLFQSSDSSSTFEKKIYIFFSKVDLVFISIAALFSVFSLAGETVLSKIFTMTTLVALILSFFFKLIMQIGKWDRKWFDKRAVAESVKTSTWRYLIGAAPFKRSLSLQVVNKKFVDRLEEILRSRPAVSKSLAKNMSSGEHISDKMREIRQLDLDERKSIYLKQRIQGQKEWYNKKASYHSNKETRWFWATLIAELIAILAAFYIMTNLSLGFNPIGALTTLVVVFCAWSQLKKHRGLSWFYALAVQELSSIEGLMDPVNTEDTLSAYVINAENAISKEHTMYCAKRI